MNSLNNQFIENSTDEHSENSPLKDYRENSTKLNWRDIYKTTNKDNSMANHKKLTEEIIRRFDKLSRSNYTNCIINNNNNNNSNENITDLNYLKGN